MLKDLIKTKRLFCDGGTGTLLQEMGLKSGETPELWNITNPDKITALHTAYLDAGSDIITTNTFGVNSLKYDNYEELIVAAVNCAKKAVNAKKNKFIAFDMGPLGKLLEPLGELKFEDAIEVFSANVRVVAKNGADLILIETINDSYEAKAAVLAAKENCNLPIFVTCVYDESCHLMTGADPASMVALLEGLKVDALGVNCSLGPDKMIPVVKELVKYASVPVIVNPNAGLPEIVNGNTTFNVNAEEFSDSMREIANLGATVLGGCCGTTPEFIKKTIEKTKDIPLFNKTEKTYTLVSSYTQAVEIGDKPILIGERINPTGKPKFKEALKNNDINYILNEGITQAEKNVHILDINVGLPEIDEENIMLTVVKQLQAVCDTPLQIDTTNPNVLEKALRCYNGKALVNSVNGDNESMENIFPIVAKYGGAVIALTLDKNGIPETAEERFNIAQRIIEKAKKYGIEKRDIIVDPLALTISSNPKSARVTLDTIKLLKDAGIKTSLGVSNISFGLPCRPLINSAFFTMALQNGLDCAIMNPFSEDMMNAYYSSLALLNLDTACADYISYADDNSPKAEEKISTADLKTAIIRGIKEEAEKQTKLLIDNTPPLEIINNFVIPALDEIGNAFENKKAYLPQLLMSAEAATTAFKVIKTKIPPSKTENGKKIIIATVKGDIHDIGKNIVKVMLESYGFNVIDLGKDVPPQKIVETAIKENCRLVGLSALMTTTVPSMEETIKQLKSTDSSIKIVVGGAVLTKDYAVNINADFYAKDAMDTVRFTEKFYNA